jgi:TonB family protein
MELEWQRAQEETRRHAEEKRRLVEEREATRRAAEKAAEEQRAQEQRTQEQEKRLAASQARARRIDELKQRIAEKIRGYMKSDESARSSCKGEFKLRLLPTGEVLHATLISSSGNKIYDDAVAQAITPAQPLPVPGPELFSEFREFALSFGEDTTWCKPNPSSATATTVRTVTPVYWARAIYPRVALRQGLEGRVMVRLTVSDTGRVDYVEVLESTPRGVFDKATIDAARKSVFEPDGTWYHVDREFSFVLTGERDGEQAFKQVQ